MSDCSSDVCSSDRSAPHLAPGAVLTDIGSVKQAVVAAVQPHVPAGVHFIPGHPIAGTEKSGPDAGSGALFEGRFWILTPLDGTDPAPLARLEALWRGCGAIVEELPADYHTKVLAVTPHLPHQIGRAAGWERVGQYVKIAVVDEA